MANIEGATVPTGGSMLGTQTPAAGGATFSPHTISSAMIGAGMAADLINGLSQQQTQRAYGRAEAALARASAAAVDTDILANQIAARRRYRLVRQQRARERGSIRAAAAASGVVVDKGSALAALAESAEAGAQEEMQVTFESQSLTSRLKSEKRDILRQAGVMSRRRVAAGDAALRSGIYSATGGVGQIVGSMSPEGAQ